MALITPDRISFSATITEEDLRDRMKLEVLEQIDGIGIDGKPKPELQVTVKRGESRKGGYTITVTGAAPSRLFLPRS